MFDNLRKKLYFARSELLFDKGISDGSIVPFDDEFYQAMSHTYISSIPVSMDIKYFKPKPGEFGNCHERSLKMFFYFDDALLVRGNRRDLEFIHGKEDSCHGWIEIGDYVYDPTSLYKFKKDIYYQMYGPTNIKRYTKEEYISIDGNKEFYENVKNTTLDDFRPGGSKRHDLLLIVPFLYANSKFYGEEFKIALDDYLDSIQYDETQISRQLDDDFQKFFKSLV